MIIYQFLFCHCTFEGGWTTMSLHKTKRGAYFAMRKYIVAKYMEEYNFRFIYGKDNSFGAWKTFWDKSYKISEIEVLD